jgi:hypothetical protein
VNSRAPDGPSEIGDTDMNIGPDNFGNGSKTDDRFSGSLGTYRGVGRRDTLDHPVDELSARNGSSIDRVSMPLDASPIAASITAPKLPDPSLSDLGPLSEPMFGRDTWLDAPTGSLADHPLLRGLLMELPPKGTMPQQDWLDRWFEAARSILELIYSQEARS